MVKSIFIFSHYTGTSDSMSLFDLIPKCSTILNTKQNEQSFQFPSFVAFNTNNMKKNNNFPYLVIAFIFISWLIVSAEMYLQNNKINIKVLLYSRLYSILSTYIF